MTTITRAYETEHDANSTVDKLREAGISDTQIQVIKPAQGDAAAANYLRAGGVLGKASSVEPYAIALERGQTLVATQAPFGSGVRISALMDACNPAPLEEFPDEDDPYHPGTPMSFLLGMPVLSRNNPTPLADFLGLKKISRSKPFLTAIAGDELTDNQKPYRGILNLPLLSDPNKTIFSRFGLPELKRSKTGDSSFGLPLLINNPTPLSNAIGMKTLTDRRKSPARSFGLPTLTE